MPQQRRPGSAAAMNRAARHTAELAPLLAGADQAPALAEYLLAHSGLPGPRGNLELAAALAEAVGRTDRQGHPWDLLQEWLDLDADQAPVGDPREFLCFCAVLALSAAHAAAPEEQDAVLRRLKQAANDARWRVREAVAMALQRIGEGDAPTLFRILGDWLVEPTWLEQRAVVAALAHPPLLREPAAAAQALALAEAVLAGVAGSGPEQRAAEGFTPLRKGLGYGLSVLVAASPEAGFELLRRWSASPDPDVRWILRENLRKNRLRARNPGRVAQLLAALEAQQAPGRPRARHRGGNRG